MARFGVGRGVYTRHRLDLSPGDIFFGFCSSFLPSRRGRLESEVLGLCRLADDGLVCHSVPRDARTCGDLCLRRGPLVTPRYGADEELRIT